MPSVNPQPEKPLTNVPQPASSAQAKSGMAPPTASNVSKQKKIAFALAILSIVIFVVGLIAGFTLAVAAILGAYALSVGIRSKSLGLIVTGSIGLALNLGLFLLASFANL